MPPASPRSMYFAGCASSPTSAPSTSAPPAAAANAASSDVTLPISMLDALPAPLFQARPFYPAALRDKKQTGEAVVDFVVDVNGDVRNAIALRATHPEFGAAAVAAVEKWKLALACFVGAS